MPDELPRYAELPVRPDAPPRSSWGLWGDDDVLGTLNLLTPERALRATASIRTGRWFALSLDLALPDPPLFGRPPLRHEVTGGASEIHDDVLHDFNTQSSAQWDGFRHFPHREHGLYNGLADTAHGIDHWAARGIVGRAVLLDLDRWRASIGRPLRQGTGDPVLPDELDACIAAQGSPLEVGDILLLRTGWLTWYRTLDATGRATYAGDGAVPRHRRHRPARLVVGPPRERGGRRQPGGRDHPRATRDGIPPQPGAAVARDPTRRDVGPRCPRRRLRGRGSLRQLLHRRADPPRARGRVTPERDRGALTPRRTASVG